MNIVISAHFDLARPVMFIKLDSQGLNGLVDNFTGIFVAYQASRKTGTDVYFTNYEELEYDGAFDVASKLDKEKDLVIVVDTIRESDAQNMPATVANIYGIEVSDFKEKFKNQIDFIDGEFEPTEDESWVYGKKSGFKTFYFGVPIKGNNYHATNNSAGLTGIDKATEVLVNVINYLKEKYK